jgi:sodium/hydrogen antiporter
LSEADVALVAIGALVLILGLLSEKLKRIGFVSAPIIALCFGIVISPDALGAIHPALWGDYPGILHEIARLTIGIAVMGAALRLPSRFLFRHWRSMGILLGAAMPLMALMSGLLVWALFDFPFWLAMLIGAAVSPTDPILATSLVSGKFAEENLPEPVRHVITAESGVNDGLGMPLVMVCIFQLHLATGEALAHWLTHTVLWETAGGIGLGALAGHAAGWLLNRAEHKAWMEETSILGYTLALTLVVLGGAELAGANGILAVFIAGIAFDNTISSQEKWEEENVQEAVNHFFTLPIFTLIGLQLPWAEWKALGWRGVALAGLILLLRRLPAILVLRRWIPLIRKAPDALFAGWFGPIGIAAVYYAQMSVERTGHKEIWPLVSLVVCASVLTHGVTATPFTKLYSGRKGQATQASSQKGEPHAHLGHPE